MIGRLNHVTIAVPDLDAAARTYRDILGAEVSAPQEEPDHGVRVIFVNLPNTKIELLEPLGEDSPIVKFLARNGDGGIHHLCYEVDDIIAALRTFIISDLLIDETADFSDDDELVHSGLLDSISMVRLVTFLEDTFSIEVANKDFIPENFHCLTAIRRLLERQRVAD